MTTTECQEPGIPVIFRKSEGEVTAVFPTFDEGNGLVACYAHIGQHGACCRGWYASTKAAKPSEYADLLAELRSIGYRPKVYRRWARHFRA